MLFIIFFTSSRTDKVKSSIFAFPFAISSCILHHKAVESGVLRDSGNIFRYSLANFVEIILLPFPSKKPFFISPSIIAALVAEVPMEPFSPFLSLSFAFKSSFNTA